MPDHLYGAEFIAKVKEHIALDPAKPDQLVQGLHRSLDSGDDCVGRLLEAIIRRWRLTPEQAVEALENPEAGNELLKKARQTVAARQLYRQWHDMVSQSQHGDL